MTGHRRRARDLGLPLDGVPGAFNAITDVPGLHVGATTLVEAQPRPGRPKPVRTGVTAILPHAEKEGPVPVWAGCHRFNGNGEMTGTHWIEDGGWFFGPVLLTNTHSVGVAHHAAIRWMTRRYAAHFAPGRDVWAMPVVAETYDGVLSDINGFAVTEDHVFAALDGASGGPVAEGCTGGGTGMIAYGFKGGTGTASRRVESGGGRWTLGVLVQANHGLREWLTVCGTPVGRMLPADALPGTGPSAETGSIIVVIATDAPLLPHQLRRVARRGAIGIGRGGTVGGNGSGDLFLAFSTANERPMPGDGPPIFQQTILADEGLDAIYTAVVGAVEEAVLNALLAATDTGGTSPGDRLVPAIDPDLLQRLVTGR